MAETSRLLIDERVVAVQPSLIRLFGPAAAIVLQQVHWHLQAGANLGEYDGHDWLVLTREDMAEETGLSVDQIKRAVALLVEAEVLICCQPEAYQRRKWYRVNIVALQQEAESPDGTGTSHEASTPDGTGEYASSPTTQRSKTFCATRAEGSLFTDSDASRAGPERANAPDKERAQGRARPRNPIWDGLAKVYPTATDSERGVMGRAVKELAALDPPPDEGTCERAAAWVLHKYPESSVMAVTKHWSVALRQRGVATLEERAGPVDPPIRPRAPDPTGLQRMGGRAG